MKTLKAILLGSIAAFCMTACQNDEIDPNNSSPLVPGEGETVIDFALNTNAIPQVAETRTYTPDHTTGKFFIYAFRKDGNTFKYEKLIDTSAMTVTYSLDSNGNRIGTLAGQAIVRVGIYKFMATYGGEQTGSLDPQDWESLENGKLELTKQLTDEIFLPVGKTLDDLVEYDFKVSDPEAVNEKVKETLKRAVSRVDIVFISAKRIESGGYMEQSYVGNSSDILGDENVTIDMKLKNVTWSMDYFGTPNATYDDTKTLDIQLADLTRGTAGDGKITIGSYIWNGDNATKFAASPMFADDYTNFDNVLPEVIRSGGAHVFGPYLFPNASTHGNVTAVESLVVTGKTSGTIRTIPINEKLKIEQNKVTIIKVYVVQGGNPIDPPLVPIDPTDPTGPTEPDPTYPVDPNEPTDPDPENPTPPTPPNVFETNVTFEVVIETKWNGSNIVEAEID